MCENNCKHIIWGADACFVVPVCGKKKDGSLCSNVSIDEIEKDNPILSLGRKPPKRVDLKNFNLVK